MFGEVDNSPTGDGFTSVVAGEYHSCALSIDNSATCWGIDDSSDADLGQVRDTPALEFVQIDANRLSTCGIVIDGSIRCWGDDRKGQIANIPAGTDFRQISVGNDHICALRQSGLPVCWGTNSINSPNDHGAAEDVPNDLFVQIAAGYHHSCGIQDGGQTTCWGSNASEQLDAPTIVMQTVAVGKTHSCAATPTGSVYCWGSNLQGEGTPTECGDEFWQVSKLGRWQYDIK